MKHLKWVWALSCALLLLAFSGCSYKELDEKLQDTIQQIEGVEDQSVKENPPKQEDQTIYKGIGETFSAYKKYVVDFGEAGSTENEKGKDGLAYTLKGATAYASIHDANVDMYGCMFSDNDELLKDNAFILIDVQASYTAPAEGDQQIIADAGELSGTALESKMAGKTADGLWPMLVYFSMRPKEDDPLLDSRHQMFSYIIEDGETLDFQVGLICSRDYIDAKNVFLEVNELPSTNELYKTSGDTARKLFVLFPEGEG